MRRGKEYLICSNDYLQTAFFIGSAEEVAHLLGLKNTNSFLSSLAHGHNNFFKGFFHVEIAPPEEPEIICSDCLEKNLCVAEVVNIGNTV